MLTWWGVSVAIMNHNALGGVLVGQATMTRMVPIFVAVIVWLTRVLIIGTFSIAGDRLFTSAEAHAYQRPASRLQPQPRPQPRPVEAPAVPYTRPAPKPVPPALNNFPRSTVRPEPTYHPVGVAARSESENPSPRS